jgi:hypothetical protein
MKSFYASLGRYKLTWGPMRNGLAISDASSYYDNISSSYTYSPLEKRPVHIFFSGHYPDFSPER